jgi:hypothetical protein
VFTSPTTLGVLAALVGAGAYGAPQAVFLVAGEDGCERAAMEIRRAQVELYCSHDAEAMMEIRTARALLHLMHDGRYGEALVGLDRAAWMARQGRLTEAEDALQDALTSLRAALARA